MKKVFVYGLADAKTSYAVVKYQYIKDEDLSIKNIAWVADRMKKNYPTVTHVYVIEDRPGLYWDYMDAIREHSVESFALFKSILENEGLKLEL